MADNEVKIVVTAADKASREIKKVSQSLEETSKKSGFLKGAWNDLNKLIPGLSGAFSAMLNPITLITAGIGAITKVTSQSIVETVAYNKEIRELTQTLGLSAEETSRIVQVADDWGVSIENVRSALAIMNKNGVTPSIDNLADLADEYVNTTNKAEFAEHAAKLLGRQYETLIPLFAQGGDALREQAAAIDDNMLATDESIKASREYEVAMDNLADTVQGLKYQLGNKLLPVMNDVITAFADSVSAAIEFSDVLDEYNEKVEEGTVVEDRRFRTTTQFGRASRSAAAVQLQMQNAIEKATEAEEAQTNQTESLSRRLYNVVDASDKWARNLEEITSKDIVPYVKDYSQEMDNLNTIIGSNLTQSNEEFIASQDELAEKLEILRIKIAAAANAEGTWYKDESGNWVKRTEYIQGLQGEYSTLKGQYDENARAHEEATSRIILDLVAQKLAMSDLPLDEQITAIAEIAKQWGLYDETQATAMSNTGTAIQEFLNGGTLEQLIQGLTEARDMAQGIEGTYDIEFRVSMTGANAPALGGSDLTDPSHYGDFASGADFIVPPGFPNDSYTMGVTTGEHVTVIPSESNTNNTFNMTVHTNAGTSTLTRDFAMLKAWAG